MSVQGPGGTDRDRYLEGVERYIEVTGEKGRETLAWLEEVAPDLGRYIVEFGYADIYSRPGLELRERQIATLASLVTQGDSAPQLRIHIGAALRAGIGAPEVVEVILQCLPFVGFPRVLNAVAVLGEVLEAPGAAPLD